MRNSRLAPWLALLALATVGCSTDFSKLFAVPTSSGSTAPTTQVPSTSPSTGLTQAQLAAQHEDYLKQAAGFSANLKQAAGFGAILNGPAAGLKQAAGLAERLSSYRVADLAQSTDAEADTITWTGTFQSPSGSFAAEGSIVGTPIDKPTEFALDLTVATASGLPEAFLGSTIKGTLAFAISPLPGLRTKTGQSLAVKMGGQETACSFEFLAIGSEATRFNITMPLASGSTTLWTHLEVGGTNPTGWVALDQAGQHKLGKCSFKDGRWTASPFDTNGDLVGNATSSIDMPAW